MLPRTTSAVIDPVMPRLSYCAVGYPSHFIPLTHSLFFCLLLGVEWCPLFVSRLVEKTAGRSSDDNDDLFCLRYIVLIILGAISFFGNIPFAIIGWIFAFVLVFVEVPLCIKVSTMVNKG